MPELRAARIAVLEHLADGIPGLFDDKIAALRRGDAVVLDSEQMFGAVFRIAPEVAAQKYAYRSDPTNRRRFLLDQNDVVTELEPETP